METTDHTEWKTLCLEGKHCLALYVDVVCGIFFFLMELFNERLRLGESDYVMMDCSFGVFVFIFLIFLAGN